MSVNSKFSKCLFKFYWFVFINQCSSSKKTENKRELAIKEAAISTMALKNLQNFFIYSFKIEKKY